ncbi:DNA helicase-2/ATP-dependent DNA helicase PcrA [Larkinella arboricola]|uniref:DNA 3'-5' helicase n=1 Tax=Larkinella arboricola TaxID=643671 RepID=A0A327X879_LARAB|nr:ATP-dependent DNA helicase [Larkinella arboricola]RAK02899.1 DNA helicase-2/ATP-dependent DNA helicase PcrA [Larkinella arboricola]
MTELNHAPNSSQLKAIATLEGPLLIIAGPGSGKTKTLVDRIVRLIEQGIPAEDLFVATFTEKAAKELVTRISNQLLRLDIRVNLNEMYLGTLHSLFLRLLEEYREYTRFKRSYRILDDFDQQFLIYRNISRFDEIQNVDVLTGPPTRSRWERASSLVRLLGKVSEEYIDAITLSNSADLAVQVLGQTYILYREILLEENVLDFAVIQTELLHLLETQPQILSRLQEKFKYLMIDEYQDTNTIQERIVLLLADAKHNLCVVGDDDQGLYRFRGASIRNILEFPNHFAPSECTTIRLETNYRSHPDIIAFYNDWMARLDWSGGTSTCFRYDKTIIPRPGSFHSSPSVIRVGASGSFERYCEEVLAFIRQLENSGKISDYNQIAMLFRSVRNDQVLALAAFLEDNGVPVFSPRSALFFERDEIKLLLGALVFLFPNLFEDLKWQEDAQLGIWDRYTEWKQFFADALRADKNKHRDLILWVRQTAKIHATMASSTTYALAALLYQLLEFPMFAEFLEVDMNDKKRNLRAAFNIALLSKILYRFEYLYDVTILTPKKLQSVLQSFFNQYLRFVYEGGIQEYEDFDEMAPSGCVSFMTIHQAKGLEFPIVMVGSLNGVPRSQTEPVDLTAYLSKPPFEPTTETHRFDFWRLYYTAFSRPQNLLVLTTYEKQGQGRSPSKYFDEVYWSLPSWRDARFRLDDFVFDSLKPVNLKHEYSFTSHILLYENCPLQYKFYKELEFVEVRTGGVLGGSLLHQTIEDIHRHVLRGEPHHELTDEKIKGWYDLNYYLLAKQQRTQLRQAQLDALYRQILRYRDRQANQWHLIREAEVDVSLVKEDYILKGTIDLIEGENGTVELVDFKSGDKPDVNTTDPRLKKQLNQYRRQLEIYAHLVEERTGQTVSRMNLYYPKEESGSPYVSFPYNRDNVAVTVGSFDEVVKKIEAHDYDMAHTPKTEKLCGDCDMRYHCNPTKFSL